MSIRGIDTQIMIQRTNGLVKEANRTLKTYETNQYNLDIQRKMQIEHGQRQINNTSKIDESRIQNDQKDKTPEKKHSKKRRKSEKSSDASNHDPDKYNMSPEGGRIDIKI